MIGLSTSLRAVLFHSVGDGGSCFTDGLGVTTAESVFRARVEFLRKRYHPVDLEAVGAAVSGERLPPRALLVTIDDAYASVADTMAGVLDEAGVPSVFFVNGAFVDHQQLGTDNLVAFTANTLGGRALQAAAAEVGNGEGVTSIDEALGAFVPTLDQGALGSVQKCTDRGSRPRSPRRCPRRTPLHEQRRAPAFAGLDGHRQPYEYPRAVPHARR